MPDPEGSVAPEPDEAEADSLPEPEESVVPEPDEAEADSLPEPDPGSPLPLLSEPGVESEPEAEEESAPPEDELPASSPRSSVSLPKYCMMTPFGSPQFNCVTEQPPSSSHSTSASGM